MGLAPVSVTKYPAHHLSRGRQGKFIEEFNPAGVFMGRKSCFYKIADLFFNTSVSSKPGLRRTMAFSNSPLISSRIPTAAASATAVCLSS